MNSMGHLHTRYVHGRRVRVLSDHLAELIPRNASVLDVGCGDGLVSLLITQKRPDLRVRGIETLIRDRTHIPVCRFDGDILPCRDRGVDVVTFVDVLHHTQDPMMLLREGARAAQKAIVIKDHMSGGVIDNLTLRFMDRLGNIHHRVALPYMYWSEERWFGAFETLNLRVGVWRRDLKLYPRPVRWIFERSLHFIARLDKT